jgi:hypothetical protein
MYFIDTRLRTVILSDEDLFLLTGLEDPVEQSAWLTEAALDHTIRPDGRIHLEWAQVKARFNAIILMEDIQCSCDQHTKQSS